MAEAEEHSKMYKNVGKGEQDASRKKRTETTIQLRREKRGNELNKRRNIDENAEYESEISDYEKDKGFQCTFPQARQILMQNPSQEDLRNVFQFLRRQLSKPQNAPINELVQEGLVMALVQGLTVEDSKVQYEAAWALTNVVSGDASHTQTAVNCGATQAFIKAACTTDLALAEQCFWGLANIIGDCAALRDHAIECGFLDVFGKIINDKLNEMKISFVRTLAWCCTNLCRHKNPQLKDEYISFILPYINIFLLYKDTSAKTDACWSLSYLTDSTEEALDMTSNAGLLPAVRAMLNPKSPEQLGPSIRVFGNFASGTDAHTEKVLEMGIIAKEIPAILQQAPTKIVKEIMWLLSNVLAGTTSQIQAVIDAELIPHVLQALRVGDFRVQSEAIWSISNLCHSGTVEQIYYLASLRVFDYIVPLLQIRSTDFIIHILSVIKSVFHAISVLHPEHLEDFKQSFEEVGGIDSIEELQNHENTGVYELAYELINTYFNDEDDGENVNPEAKAGEVGDAPQPVFQF